MAVKGVLSRPSNPGKKASSGKKVGRPKKGRAPKKVTYKKGRQPRITISTKDYGRLR